FGVAIFGTILTRRTIFHSAIYGQQLNPYSAAYRGTMNRLQYFATHTVGGTVSEALSRANALIISSAENQAFVRAVDDVFILSAVILLVSLVPILLLRTHKKGAARGAAALE
ncbi:MAG: hypothetical protein PVI01_18160, partial [Gemmatimonadales bacterium]